MGSSPPPASPAARPRPRPRSQQQQQQYQYQQQQQQQQQQSQNHPIPSSPSALPDDSFLSLYGQSDSDTARDHARPAPTAARRKSARPTSPAAAAAAAAAATTATATPSRPSSSPSAPRATSPTTAPDRPAHQLRQKSHTSLLIEYFEGAKTAASPSPSSPRLAAAARGKPASPQSPAHRPVSPAKAGSWPRSVSAGSDTSEDVIDPIALRVGAGRGGVVSTLPYRAPESGSASTGGTGGMGSTTTTTTTIAGGGRSPGKGKIARGQRARRQPSLGGKRAMGSRAEQRGLHRRQRSQHRPLSARGVYPSDTDATEESHRASTDPDETRSAAATPSDGATGGSATAPDDDDEDDESDTVDEDAYLRPAGALRSRATHPPSTLASSLVSSTYPNPPTLPSPTTPTPLSHPHPPPLPTSPNPRLLESVEDVIRRLILPELAELKNHQKLQANRGLFERKIAQSGRLRGVSEDVREQALRTLLAKHRSAPDVICAGKGGAEGGVQAQAKAGGGGAAEAAAKAAAKSTAARPVASRGDARVGKRAGGEGGAVQGGGGVVPDSVAGGGDVVGGEVLAAAAAAMGDEKGAGHALDGNGKAEGVGEGGEGGVNGDNEGASNEVREGVGSEKDGETEQAGELGVNRFQKPAQKQPTASSNDAHDAESQLQQQQPSQRQLHQQPQQQQQRQQPSPTPRAQSRFSLRSTASTDSASSAGADMPRRKSRSLREAENKGLVSSLVKNLNRGGAAGETIDEGGGEGVRTEGARTEGARTEVAFRRAGVPEMPFRSAVGSDVTRSSIRSEESEGEGEGKGGGGGAEDAEKTPTAPRRGETRQRNRFEQPLQSPASTTTNSPSPTRPHPRSRSPIKRKPLPSDARNISDQSTSTLARGPAHEFSPVTASFSDPSTCHLPSATTSEVTSYLAALNSPTRDSLLGLSSQDVLPPTSFTGVVSDESALSAPNAQAGRNDVDEDKPGKQVEHLNAEHRAAVLASGVGVESAVASLVSSGNGDYRSRPETILESDVGIDAIANQPLHGDEGRVDSAHSRRSREKHEQDRDDERQRSRSSSTSSSTSSPALSNRDRSREETGIATEPDSTGLGTGLRRENDLSQHRHTSRDSSLTNSRTSSDNDDDDDDTGYDATRGPEDSTMLGVRETNNSPYPFARPPAQFESPAQSLASLRGARRNQATVEDADADADEVETNPSIIHGPSADPAVSAAQLPGPPGGMLPAPLVQPGGGGGGLRYNPVFAHSQEDYGKVVRQEAVARPGEGGGGVRRVQEEGRGKDNGAVPGVSAALASAAAAAGLDPEKLTKGNMAFERTFMGSRETDASFPDVYHDMRQFSSSSESTNPLFDSAGKTFENIENKDIMALMQHLTVRDAQRNARDTEILFTLVRSAADMRNSFEEMKRFIAQQDEIVMESNDRQHEATRKAINGPRPPPIGFTRKPTVAFLPDEEGKGKKKNVFKRAMKGLSGKSSNELTKIEEMLYHLLAEVEQLRMAQNQQLGQQQQQQQQQQQPQQQPTPDTTLGSPLLEASRRQSLQEKRLSLPPPEKAGVVEGMIPIRLVPSTDRPVGAPSQQRPKSFAPQPTFTVDPGLIIDRGLESHQPHRVSPIHEADERSYASVDHDDGPLTPEEERYLEKTRMIDENSLILQHRAPTGLIPSPRVSRTDLSDAEQGNNGTSHEAQRKLTASPDSAKEEEAVEKRKRGFFKKFKKGFARKEKAQSGGEETEAYSDQNSPVMEAAPQAQPQQSGNGRSHSRPPSPLIPSELSALSQVSEPPRYRANRDGTSLLHPKPRPYATEAHKNQLESEAQNFVVKSPRLDDWNSASSVSFRKDSGAYQPGSSSRRHPSDPISPVSEATNTTSQSRRSQRARQKDDGPLVPERANGSGRDYQSYATGSRTHTYGSSSSGSLARISPMPGMQRKLTGPRPLNNGSGRAGNYQARRWTESPEPVQEY